MKSSTARTPRRSFLGRTLGAAAVGLPFVGTRAVSAQEAPADDWIKEVKGTHRCLFDFPQHKNGMPLLHILNYLNTYATAYKTEPGQVGAVGTFYSVGSQASIPLGVQRRHLGEVRARRVHRAQGRGRQAVHAERVQPADDRRICTC